MLPCIFSFTFELNITSSEYVHIDDRLLNEIKSESALHSLCNLCSIFIENYFA